MSMTVKECLKGIEKKGKSPNRFNKRSFTQLMTCMANDPGFTAKVVKIKGGEIAEVQSIMVSKGFREFCKKMLEKSGVDKEESGRILSKEFEFTQADMNGLYEFFATAIYEYMAAGNYFEFLPTEDFKGSISIKDVPKSEKVAEAFSPKDRKSLGKFKTTKKKHKELVAKSSCPAFLKTRTPV